MLSFNAGAMQVCYEKGFLRYIKTEGNEILRMIYFALRDENWGTLSTRIDKEEIHTEADAFNVHYEAINFSKQQDVFRWNCSIKGEKSGKITFEISGEALVDIKKNRAGFCILHPVKESINQPVEILHRDNSTTKSIFPEHIAPDDPFKMIKAMRWVVKGRWYGLHFEGDLFETEDQRNWTDASFKTFCTPLDKPFPVLLKEGDQVYQKVLFSPEAAPSKVPKRNKIEIKISNDKIPFPALGLQDNRTPVNDKVINLIQKLGLSHLRVDINLSNADWQTDLSKAVERAIDYNIPVELAVSVSGNFKDELESFIQVCVDKKYPIKQINVYSATHLTTAQETIDFIVQLKSRIPKVKFGAGTDFNFTELNRNRFNRSSLDFVTYSIDPQEHATDDQTIIENAAAQFDTVVSAKAIYPGSNVHVSPIALKRRFNPYATNNENKVCSEEQRRDARQATTFNALWTLGSIKYLAEGGAGSLTYFQTVGPLGIISDDGVPFPVYKSFELFSEVTALLKCTSSEPLKVDGICDDGGHLIVWNYTNEGQQVYIENTSQDIALSPQEIKIISI
ncbi:MAG TPA: hypothetical protein VFW11_21320 [Cyclobacteriaceae bacterium]|nr:hypothetical protein [Cyclobacteriaceae bacterium]